MANTFDDDKHRGEKSSGFDDLMVKHGMKPAPVPTPGGASQVANPGGAGGALQTVDDAMRAAADSATFGLLDRGLEYSGLEPGAIARTQAARDRSPYATIAGDIGGFAGTIAATPLRAVGAGLSTALGGARAGARGVMGKILGYGTEGAATGAAQAAGHTYKLEDLPENLTKGAAIGAAGGAVGGAITPRSSLMPTPRAAIPTNRELGDLSDAGYAAVRRNPHGVVYSGPAVRAEAEAAKQRLYSQNIHEGTARETFRGLNMPARADDAAARAGPNVTASYTPSELDSIRQWIGRASEPSDIRAAIAAKRALDDFTAGADYSVLSRGTPAGARATDEILQTTRGNKAAQFRSDTLRDAKRNVELGSAARNSGQNFENNMRGAVARILAHREGQSFNAGETRRLEDLARRTDAWNYVRSAGNYLGGGGGLGGMVGAGGIGAAGGIGTGVYTGDPGAGFLAGVSSGVASAGIGRALRGASNRSMSRAVDQMDDIIRMRSPEFARRQALNPGTLPGLGMGVGGLATRNAIIEALIRREQADQR